MRSRAINGCFCVLVCLSLSLLPALGYSDFTVTNMFAEVGVIAGDNIDGVGGHSTTEAFFSITDGVFGEQDYQIAEALFVLAIEEDTVLGDYSITYDSQTFVSTGGIGSANALSNGIAVFSLSEEYEVTSLIGDSLLSDSLGESIFIQQGSSLLLSQGTYSLSFGSSASINSGDLVLEVANSQSGQLSFNATAVPEPGAASVCFVLLGLVARRSRRC